MSITSGITSSAKSIAKSKVNRLLGGLPGPALLNGIMGRAFGKLIDGIVSSINTIPILAEVDSFFNELADSVFSSLDGLGEAFGDTVGDFVEEGAEAIGATSFVESLTDIASFIVPDSPTFNLNLGQAAIDAVIAGDFRAGLESIINSEGIPILTGIADNIVDTVASGVFRELNNAIGGFPVVFSEGLPDGSLPRGAIVVFDADKGTVSQEVKRPDGSISLVPVPAKVALEALNHISGQSVSRSKEKNFLGFEREVNVLLPNGSEKLRGFPLTEEDFNNPNNIIIDDDGNEVFSSGAAFIYAAIETAKLEYQESVISAEERKVRQEAFNISTRGVGPHTQLFLGGANIERNGKNFPIPEILVPRRPGISLSNLRDPRGFVKNMALGALSEIVTNLIFKAFPALPIPQGGIVTEASPRLTRQSNTSIQQSVFQMRIGIPIEALVDRTVNNGIQRLEGEVGEVFFKLGREIGNTAGDLFTPEEENDTVA